MRAKDTKNARRNGKSGMNRLISFALAVAAAGSATLRAENPILPLWESCQRLAKAVSADDRKAEVREDAEELRLALKAKPLESLKPTLPRTEESFREVLGEILKLVDRTQGMGAAR